MRQSGILAAAGLFALEHNVGRLADDAEAVKRMANGEATVTKNKSSLKICRIYFFFNVETFCGFVLLIKPQDGLLFLLS